MKPACCVCAAALWALLLGGPGWAQNLMEVFPASPAADDTVTIFFDATAGNAVLAGLEGDVYIHTGVIVGTPEDPSGWRHVQGNWGQDDPRVKMQRMGDDRYRIKFHMRSFYGIEPDESFLQIACVFRNKTGDLVAKTTAGKDIYYPELRLLEDGPLQLASARDASFLGALSRYELAKNGSVILYTTDRQRVQLDFQAPGAVRVTFLPGETPFAYAPYPTDAALKPLPAIRRGAVTETAEGLLIQWDSASTARIAVSRSPMRIRLVQGGEVLGGDEKGFFVDGSDKTVGVRLALQPGERIYGTGSRALPLNRRGHRVYSYNTATYAYADGEKDLNLNIPFVMSSRGYGVLFDHPARGYYDLGKAEREVLEFGVLGSGQFSYYYILGSTPAEILAEYTALTGRQPLPPRWALGYIQSRFGYRSWDEALDITEQTLAAGYPLEAILLDLYWFGQKENMGDLDWDQTRFPDAEAKLRRLQAQGVRTILITESYFIRGTRFFDELSRLGYFTRRAGGEPYVIKDFWAGPAGLLDFTRPGASEWFWQHYKRLRMGGLVAGFWCDSGEPENHPREMVHALGTAEQVHNLYPLYWAKMLHEGYRRDFPRDRLFNLSRSGYAGVQRYGILPWSGDVTRNWDGYSAQPRIMLGAGVCGIGYMHADLGGFTNGPKNPELYRRWVQMGAFTPIMRVHGEGIPPEPIFYDSLTQRIVKQAVRLRYRFLPYNYSLAWDNHLTGQPLARAMHFVYPDEEKLAELDRQYMWGDALLVVPVFDLEAREVFPQMPIGEWVDFWSDRRLEGGRKQIIRLSDEQIPLFVRGGAFITLAPEGLRHIEDFRGDSLEIHHYPSMTGNGVVSTAVYFDDGSPEPVATGGFATLTLRNLVATPALIEAKLTLEGGYATMPQTRTIAWTAHALRTKPKTVQWTQGKARAKLKWVKSPAELRPGTAYWDPARRNVQCCVRWAGGGNASLRLLGSGLL